MKRTEKTDKILAKYKQYLKLEKSLSTNTVEAYLTDLDKLMAYLTLENLHPLEVTLEHLETFSAGLRDIGIHPRSQARILSGIRSFYHFLVLEDYLETDPTELLESPQIGFKLPEVLTVEEIDRLIESIDRSTKEGQRNRAILETLYSCGLRVSELCNLKLSDLYLNENFIKVYKPAYECPTRKFVPLAGTLFSTSRRSSSIRKRWNCSAPPPAGLS